MNIAVVGGGAAGFFAAIRAKECLPGAEVRLFEKSSQPLAKVKISGGGRCNVTNAAPTHSVLRASYPRGGNWLKRAFWSFDNRSAMQWFESRGVPLKTEPDGRVFPQSDRSQDIVDCLMREARSNGVKLRLNSGVRGFARIGEQWKLQCDSPGADTLFDKLIVATGGAPWRKGLEYPEQLGHRIVEPVPSLFSFNIREKALSALMGLSVPDAILRIEGKKLTQRGPLLITHWGLSGPAILLLSAFGARDLYEMNYDFNLRVNWTGIRSFETLRERLYEMVSRMPRKTLFRAKPFEFPARLWGYFLHRAGIAEDKPWGELGKKAMNKLLDVLSHNLYHVVAKTTFKEEFVTCGGIDLRDIDPLTMESKCTPGLYFAGEIMDIDGITGGFNFQAAWTTGYLAGSSVASL